MIDITRISSRCNEDVRSLEHLFAFFDGLFVGVLVSRLLNESRKRILGRPEDYGSCLPKVGFIITSTLLRTINERKSNQGLLHVYTPSPEGGRSRTTIRNL